jgi:hypothetical protein
MWDAVQRPRLGENVCVMVALFYVTLAGRGGSLLTYPTDVPELTLGANDSALARS